jgi:hypothetical protein
MHKNKAIKVFTLCFYRFLTWRANFTDIATKVNKKNYFYFYRKDNIIKINNNNNILLLLLKGFGMRAEFLV